MEGGGGLEGGGGGLERGGGWRGGGAGEGGGWTLRARYGILHLPCLHMTLYIEAFIYFILALLKHQGSFLLSLFTPP